MRGKQRTAPALHQTPLQFCLRQRPGRRGVGGGGAESGRMPRSLGGAARWAEGPLHRRRQGPLEEGSVDRVGGGGRAGGVPGLQLFAPEADTGLVLPLPPEDSPVTSALAAGGSGRPRRSAVLFSSQRRAVALRAINAHSLLLSTKKVGGNVHGRLNGETDAELTC